MLMCARPAPALGGEALLIRPFLLRGGLGGRGCHSRPSAAAAAFSFSICTLLGRPRLFLAGSLVESAGDRPKDPVASADRGVYGAELSPGGFGWIAGKLDVLMSEPGSCRLRVIAV